MKLSGDGKSASYHIVIGADGVGSRVRNLIFSKEVNENCFRNTNTYAAYFSMELETEQSLTKSVIQQGTGGRTIWLRPINKEGTKASCYFLTTTTPSDSTDYCERFRQAAKGGTHDQMSALTDINSSLRGLFPQAVSGMQQSADFYFSRITQVNLPSWHVSRCALVGDAAYCPSPLSGGQGTPAALVGAYILAGELTSNPDDPDAAFVAYQEKFRAAVERWSVIPPGGKAPRVIAPQTELGVRAVRAAFWVASRPMVQTLFASLPSLPGAGSGGKGKIELPDYDFVLPENAGNGGGGGPA